MQARDLIFERGDRVRVRHRGVVLRGVWVYKGLTDEGRTVIVWKLGRGAPRYLRLSEVTLVDWDAKFPPLLETPLKRGEDSDVGQGGQGS